MKTRLGKLHKVTNKTKKAFSHAKDEYTALLVKEGNQVIALLFTEKELEAAKHRALRNPEDCLKQSLASKLLD